MTSRARHSADLAADVKHLIRDVPDFPRPGIVFKDITPLLGSPRVFREVTDDLAARFAHAAVTHVVAIESRGFIFGGPVAQSLGASFVPVRKPGKLPSLTIREVYAPEYGTDTLELHSDALPPVAPACWSWTTSSRPAGRRRPPARSWIGAAGWRWRAHSSSN